MLFRKNRPGSLYCQTRLQQLPAIALRPADYQVLERPERFRERLLQLISQARQRIIMPMLYLQDDESGREVLEALYTAQRQQPNLHICVYVDFHRAQRGRIGGGGGESTNADSYLRRGQAGPRPVAVYGVPVKKREIFGVLHIKGFVFDDIILYSGASLNNDYLARDGHYRLDRYHEIRSRELAHALSSYTSEAFHLNFAVQDFSQGPVRDARELRDEIRQLRRHLSVTPYTFRSSRIRADELGITPLTGLGRGNPLNRVILWMIYAARQELFICTPYFNPPKPVLRALEDALHRRVRITLVTGDKRASDFYIPPGEKFSPIGAVPYVYEENLRHFVHSHQQAIDSRLLEVRVWADGTNSFHVKGLHADRSLALITGNNLNPRAWKLDLENGLLVHDPNHLMLEKFRHEQQFILMRTTVLHSAADLEDFGHYPEQVRSLLTKVRRFKASLLIKQLL